jgi:hypothetical protein
MAPIMERESLNQQHTGEELELLKLCAQKEILSWSYGRKTTIFTGGD